MKELDKVTSDIEKSEIDELVDYDGTMNNSKVPILDPMTTAWIKYYGQKSRLATWSPNTRPTNKRL